MAKPHWSVALQEKLQRWRREPEAFVREAFEWPQDEIQRFPQVLATWQAESLRALAEHDRIAIRSGHGVGKTTFICWVILWWQLTHVPNKVPVTANRQDQLYDVIWSELKRWHKRLHPALRNLLEVTSDKIAWKSDPDEGFAVARTARKESPEAFQGFHAKHLLFIADEASGIDDVIFEVGQGAMSTSGAKTILTGNPTRTSGYFYNAFHKNRKRWWVRRVSCLECIEEGVPWVSKDYPEEVADEFGLESNVYRYRVLGEFAKEDDDAVIPLHEIESAVGRDISLAGKCVWGLDVARFGDDRTALVKRFGNTVLEPARSWRSLDLMTVAGIVKKTFDETPKRLKPHSIMVDSIGLGAGVADRLRELSLPVFDVNVGESAPNDDKFVRLRDELWWKGREWFLGRDVKLTDDDTLIGELSSVKYSYTSSGKIKVESKDEMKKRGVMSPDIADAFLLTFAIGEQNAMWFKPIEYGKYYPEGAFV